MIFRFIYRSRVTFATLLLVLAVACSSNAAQDIQSSVNPTAAARLDLSLSGYHVPSRMDRLSENQPAVTLDFVDDTHVLLTFNRKSSGNASPNVLLSTKTA